MTKITFLEIAGHFLYTIPTSKKRGEEEIDNDSNNNGNSTGTLEN